MKKYINYKLIFVITIMIIIFIFSHDSGSTSTIKSNIFVDRFYNIFNFNINRRLLTKIIRKSAHISLYALLGFSVSNYLIDFNKKIYINSILFILIYSISDEVHQLFIPNRSGSIIDILIDLIGGIIGIILWRIYEEKRTS
jgi:hypothetical protein